jgi:flagellar secretion chaperone FliS
VRAEAGVHAASPHRLVAMLFEGLLEAIAQARGAVQAGQVQAKGAAIGRAVAILEEGLGGGLDLNTGPLAHDLNRLYSYVVTQLTLANLRSDDMLLQECQNLVRPLQDAWAAIADGGSSSKNNAHSTHSANAAVAAVAAAPDLTARPITRASPALSPAFNPNPTLKPHPTPAESRVAGR